MASAAMAQPAPKTIGGEFRINADTSASEALPRFAVMPSGSFVVAFQAARDGDSFGVFGRRFDASGNPLGGEFLINTTTAGQQLHPTIDVDAKGAFVVAWRSPDASEFGVFAQRFDADETKAGGEFRVNVATLNKQWYPWIGVADAGSFVVAWDGPDASNYGIFARVFDSGGVPQTADLAVNYFTTGFQRHANLGIDASGNFVVAWNDANQDLSGYGVFARRFDASGGALSGDIQINTFATSLQADPSIGMSPSGDFVVAWRSYGQDGDVNGVFAQRVDSGGTLQGTEIAVNSFTVGHQYQPAAAMTPGGGFVVSWTSFGQDGDATGIFSQAFDASGNRLGGEIQANSWVTGSQRRSQVGTDAAGNFVVVWSGAGATDPYGIFAQRFLGACSESLALNQNEWHLISLPCEPAVNTVQAVFGDDLSVLDYTVTWIVYRRDETTDAYVQMALGDAFEMGRGYWIKTIEAGHTVDVEGNNVDYTCPAGTTFSTSGGCHDSTTLVGAAGSCSDPNLSTNGRFNMLGHPFRTTVAFAGTRVEDGVDENILATAESLNWASDQMWWWNGTAYQARDSCTSGMEGSLTKWMGFWTRVCAPPGGTNWRISARPATGCPPPGPPSAPEPVALDGRTLSRAGPAKPKPKQGDPWYLRITATSGSLTDPGNVLGELWDSVAGYDSHDLVELQPFGSPWLTVVFPHPEWGSNASDWFTSDYHGFKDDRAWAFEVRSDQLRTVTLDLALTQLGKKAPQLEVVDGVSGAVVSVDDGSYTFVMASTRHPFTVREAKGGGRH